MADQAWLIRHRPPEGRRGVATKDHHAYAAPTTDAAWLAVATIIVANVETVATHKRREVLVALRAKQYGAARSLFNAHNAEGDRITMDQLDGIMTVDDEATAKLQRLVQIALDAFDGVTA